MSKLNCGLVQRRINCVLRRTQFKSYLNESYVSLERKRRHEVDRYFSNFYESDCTWSMKLMILISPEHLGLCVPLPMKLYGAVDL